MSKFKVGMKVRIKGDYSDGTDHLDGETATIVEVRGGDCVVKPDRLSDHKWYIWNYNMTPVEEETEKVDRTEKEVNMSLNIKNGKVKCVGYKRNERYFTVGKVYDVVDDTIVNDNGYTYKGGFWKNEGVLEYLSDWYKFEVVPTEKIIITHEYKTTTATLYRGDEKVVATARCAPEDKFDFMVGAKLAMERLNAEINKPKYYNGKVVCVNNKGNPAKYTIGKVYEFVDGTMIDNRGEATPHDGHRMTSFEEWSNWTASEFIPLVED